MKEQELKDWMERTDKKLEKLSGSNKPEHADPEKIVDVCKSCPECCKAHKKAYEKLEDDDAFDDIEEDDEEEDDL